MANNRARLCYLWLFTLVWLSACSTQPQRQAMDSDPAQLQTWHLRGKLALRQQGNNQSAYLDWQQQADTFTIAVYGPLGSGRATITGSADKVSLYHEGQLYTASSAEQLLQQYTGWQLPAGELYYWIRGLPSPNLDITRQNYQQQQLRTLQQGNWQITLTEYNQTAGIALPGKLVLQQDQLQLIILIKQWLL